MAYIGQSPSIGNFQVCDAISVVNGQAAYTMQVSSVNVVPETANHMIVSLNGIIQAPGSSFTVSGSTITFASNLVTGDVINFIHILGSVLDLGVPSDDTVSTAKISANAVTAAKFNADVISGQTALATAPADTDEFLVSDAGVLKRIDYSLIKGGGMFELISTTTVTSGVSSVDFTTLSSDYADFRISASQVDIATDDEILRMRVYIGGSEHTSSEYQYVRRGFNGGATENEDQESGTEWRFGDNIGSAGGECASFEFTVFAVHDTSHNKQYLSQFAGHNNANQPVYVAGGGGLKNTSAITGFKIYQNSGNINSGVFSLFGRKR